VNPGASTRSAQSGWGAGGWGTGSWGIEITTSLEPLRLWSQSNYGQDLVFGYRGVPAILLGRQGEGLASCRGEYFDCFSCCLLQYRLAQLLTKARRLCLVTSGALATGLLTQVQPIMYAITVQESINACPLLHQGR
jgi:hypothetical protein